MTWQMAMGISTTNGSSDLSKQSAAGSCVNKKVSFCDQLSQLQSLPACVFMPASSSPFLIFLTFSFPICKEADQFGASDLPICPFHGPHLSALHLLAWLGRCFSSILNS